MATSLPTTGLTTLQEFGGENPLAIFDVVVESFDQWGLNVRHME
jgi:hypothetical protein